MTSTTRTVARTLASALAIGAVAAPVAGARPTGEELGVYPVSNTASQSAAPPEPTVTTVEDSGFDWGSAAIGGGVVLVVVLTASGAAVAFEHRHAHGHGHAVT